MERMYYLKLGNFYYCGMDPVKGVPNISSNRADVKLYTEDEEGTCRKAAIELGAKLVLVEEYVIPVESLQSYNIIPNSNQQVPPTVEKELWLKEYFTDILAQDIPVAGLITDFIRAFPEGRADVSSYFGGARVELRVGVLPQSHSGFKSHDWTFCFELRYDQDSDVKLQEAWEAVEQGLRVAANKRYLISGLSGVDVSDYREYMLVNGYSEDIFNEPVYKTAESNEEEEQWFSDWCSRHPVWKRAVTETAKPATKRGRPRKQR